MQENTPDDPLIPEDIRALLDERRESNEEDDEPASDLLVLLLLARLIRTLLAAAMAKLIGKNRRVRIRFNGHLRTIEPHHLIRRADGSYAIIAWQVSGGSDWGDMGAKGFTRSPLGGYQGWITVPLDKVEWLEPGGGPFTPHKDYNPTPTRNLGEIIAQVLPALGLLALAGGETDDEHERDDGSSKP